MDPDAIAGYSARSQKKNSEEEKDRLLDSLTHENQVLKTYVEKLFTPPPFKNGQSPPIPHFHAQLKILKHEKEFGLEAHSSAVPWLFKNVKVTERNQQEQEKRVFLLTSNDKVFIFLLQLIKFHRGGSFCFFDKQMSASTNGAKNCPDWVTNTAKNFLRFLQDLDNEETDQQVIEMHALIQNVFAEVKLPSKGEMEENFKKVINNFWNRATSHWAETKENQRKDEAVNQEVRAMMPNNSPTSSNNNNNKFVQRTLAFNSPSGNNSSPGNNLSITTGEGNRNNNNNNNKNDTFNTSNNNNQNQNQNGMMMMGSPVTPANSANASNFHNNRTHNNNNNNNHTDRMAALTLFTDKWARFRLCFTCSSPDTDGVKILLLHPERSNLHCIACNNPVKNDHDNPLYYALRVDDDREDEKCWSMMFCGQCSALCNTFGAAGRGGWYFCYSCQQGRARCYGVILFESRGNERLDKEMMMKLAETNAVDDRWDSTHPPTVAAQQSQQDEEQEDMLKQ